MLFQTPQFFFFLGVVLILFYSTPQKWRKFILLAASYYFYMSWIPVFILLLLALTAIDYCAARWIAHTASPRLRKTALVVSLSANLGLLGFFKYYNFFAENIAQLLHRPSNAFALSIILPLGISFHTFQSMSYVIDVYRKEQEPIRNPIDYALFISFFPQLVAGPIVRAREFFGDLYAWRRPSTAEASQGILLVLLGLAKKTIMADQFAQIANAYFQDVGKHPGMLSAWSGTIAFGIQIYFDFSGYTDMAIGMAKLLGFHFPVNFRRPYLASSITDFWHRWHMSLSRWLRDYLYIPLGGNRGGTLEDLSQPDADDAAGRLVARRELEFHRVGRVSRSAAEHRADVSRRQAGGRPLDAAVSGAGRGDFRPGDGRMGIFSRRHVPR